MQLIKSLEQQQIDAINASKNILDIEVGSTIKLSWRIVEGGAISSRTQEITGVVIKKVNRGIRSSITITKAAYGGSLTYTIPLYSPLLQKFEILKRAKVRRAKLYYLVGLTGKAARLKEKKPSAK